MPRLDVDESAEWAAAIAAAKARLLPPGPPARHQNEDAEWTAAITAAKTRLARSAPPPPARPQNEDAEWAAAIAAARARLARSAPRPPVRVPNEDAEWAAAIAAAKAKMSARPQPGSLQPEKTAGVPSEAAAPISFVFKPGSLPQGGPERAKTSGVIVSRAAPSDPEPPDLPRVLPASQARRTAHRLRGRSKTPTLLGYPIGPPIDSSRSGRPSAPSSRP